MEIMCTVTTVPGVQIPFSPPYGSIAQLGEHLPYKQRVIGSSPIVPTKNPHNESCEDFYLFTITFSLFTKTSYLTTKQEHTETVYSDFIC